MSDTRPDTFIRHAMKSEMLDEETEQALARAWRDNRDKQALDRLITAYMRLAISMAMKFRRHGAPVNDLIQEAGLGLMKAAEKFDPDRGVRFSTYAMWWVKAALQDFVMRDWSLVRTGSSAAQKSLFFNLRRVQTRLEQEAAGRGEVLSSGELRSMIAAELGVAERNVEMMQGRLSGPDYSLNKAQGGDEDGREWVEVLEDENAQGAKAVEQSHDLDRIRGWLDDAMTRLTPREASIVRARRISDTPRTLAELGEEMQISKERVRQIEAAALAKMRKTLEARKLSVHHFFA